MIKNYLEKTYAGFLGMNIGIRIGAPVEATLWTYERIRDTYGDITDYVKDYINFAADDDANGPVFFLRALYDDAKDGNVKPQDVARAWLNYARDGKGMFWWGGYGRSTEHTTYINLKRGIEAPLSGSIKQNGQILAEQIGGQIFIDTWGLITPCNPTRAADLGEIAASVSHDGEGMYGARFFCAAISEAYQNNDIESIVDRALKEVPKASKYYAVAQVVKAFYKENPDDFRACRDMLERDWGYDKYLGVCHMIPNAGICILSMLYGKGDFNRTVEIATMCGWDTDCNAGNVGTVLGVMCGIEGLAERYRKPINDSIVLSSIAGSLNILDIPTYAKELALIGYKTAGEDAPKELVDSFKEGEIFFDFELAGSTHNIRVSDTFHAKTQHSTKHAYSGTGSLEIQFDRMDREDSFKIFYKPYYLRKDFSDERYSPVFSPTVYSGQKVSMKIYLDQFSGLEAPMVAPYIRLANEERDVFQGFIRLKHENWIEVEFDIPDSNGDLISEVGVLFEVTSSKEKSLGNIYIDDFRIYGKSKYSIDFAKQRTNFGCISPFSHNYGAWDLYGDKVYAMSDGYAQSFAGAYFSKDYSVKTTITPLFGDDHMLAIRAQGAARAYYVGFTKSGKLGAYKDIHGLSLIKEVDFTWEHDREYEVKAIAKGAQIEVFVEGKLVLTFEDDSFAYGMYGMARLSMGRTAFGNFEIEEI